MGPMTTLQHFGTVQVIINNGKAIMAFVGAGGNCTRLALHSACTMLLKTVVSLHRLKYCKTSGSQGEGLCHLFNRK